MVDKQLDFGDALNCIRQQLNRGGYRGLRIGIVAKEVTGMCGSLQPGRVVLFERACDRYPHNNDDKTITVETPMPPAEIERQKAKGSCATTWGTIINVPAQLVQEVKGILPPEAENWIQQREVATSTEQE